MCCFVSVHFLETPTLFPILVKVSETRKHIRAGIMQNLFLTKITMWANTRPSSFAVSNTICPARKTVKLFVGTTGTENILLFCITRATPPLQLICFRVLVLKGSQDHWSVPQTLLRSHEILSLTTYLGEAGFSSSTPTKNNTSNWMQKQQ